MWFHFEKSTASELLDLSDMNYLSKGGDKYINFGTKTKHLASVAYESTEARDSDYIALIQKTNIINKEKGWG